MRVFHLLWRMVLISLLTGASASQAEARDLVGITVEPANLVMEPDQTYSYRAFANYSDNTRSEITPFVTWRTSSSSVARVSNGPGSAGVVTARRPGSVSVTAIFYYFENDSRGSADLEVDAGPVVGLRTKPTSKSLEVGQSELFEARLTYRSGYDIDITDRVRWSSSNPSIASIGPQGPDGIAVSAHRVGTTTISAYDPETGFRNTDGQALVRARVTHIDFEQSSYVLGDNMLLPLRVYGYRADGTRSQITDDVRYEIQPDRIIEIAEGGANAGRITPIRVGTATVDAIDERRGLRASESLGAASVRVEGSLREVIVRPLTLNVGESRNARVHGLLSTGAVTSDLRRVVFWESENTSIATVSNTSGNPGSVTSLRSGTTTLTATDPSTGIASLQTDNLEVRGEITSIEIEPASLRLGIGLRYPLRAYARRDDGSRSNITSTVVWSTGNESAATIDEDGWLQAVATGQSDIQALHPPTGISSASGISGNVTIAGNVESLDIIPLRVSAGSQRKAKAYGQLSDGSQTDDLRPALEWSIADPELARVGSAENPDLDPGEVEGIRAGWTTIVARDPINGWTTRGVRNLKVQGAITSILMEAPDDGLVPLATPSRFKVRAIYEDSERLNISDKCEWSSDNPQIASVQNQSPDKGVVTGHRVGESTKIRATCEGLSTELEAVVLGSSTGLRFATDRTRFAAYRNYKFRVYASYANDQEVDVTQDIVWVVTNPAVAELDPDEPGRVHFLDSGETMLVAAYENGFFAILEIEVYGGVEEIQFTPKKVTIRGGSGRRLRVTGSIPGQRGDITMTRRVDLQSSDESIVRLAPTEKEPGRILTGGTAGTATITATTSSGIQATATVRVRDVLKSLEIKLRQNELQSEDLGRFQVIGTYENGKRRYLTRYAEVTSSDPSVIEVSGRRGSYGKMYAKRVGEAQIQAFDAGSGIASASVTVRVTSEP